MTRSAISAEDVVHGLRDLSYVVRAGSRTYWVESRRDTAGEVRLWCADDDGDPRPALPAGRGARSQVYGYGARPYVVAGSTIFFVDAADQCLHRYAGGGATTYVAVHRPTGGPHYSGSPPTSE